MLCQYFVSGRSNPKYYGERYICNKMKNSSNDGGTDKKLEKKKEN